MRSIATEEAEAVTTAGVVTQRDGSQSWFKVHKCAVAVAVIMILAFALRLVFSYGISTGSNYALSGGTDASSHLRIIMGILAGTYDPALQAQLNYPFGVESTSGPFFDYLMAGVAYIVTLFGVPSATAASGTLAWAAPILSVLTAIPVYLVAKKLTDDRTIAIVSVILFEFGALVVSVSPFSYGCEYALLGFLATWMVYALVCAIRTADEKNLVGIKSVLNKGVFVPAIAAGLLFGLVCQTWLGFHIIVVVSAVVLGLHLVVSRIQGRDLGVSVGIATVFLGVGTVIAAAYYLPFGLWDVAFSGACVLAILTVVFAVAFLLVEKQPWVVTVPVLAIAIVAVAVVLAVFAPSIGNAIVNGNNAYAAGLFSEMASSSSRTSIGSMATWFGWLTVWLPLILGGYMLYNYRSESGKRLYDFTIAWVLGMFIISWFNSEYAILAAAAMAFGAAVVLVRVCRYVDIMGYFRSLKTLRGSGLKGGAKKVFNFFPFVTVVVVAALVIIPNAAVTYDASTPTNDEHPGYTGSIGYTINTSDASMVNSTWNHYNGIAKDGALLSWYGYSDTAVAYGGFNSVTSSNGDGTAAMSVALMQNGSTGALVSMTVRLMEKISEKDASSKIAEIVKNAGITHVTVDANVLKDIITNTSKAQQYIDADTVNDYKSLNLDDNLRTYYGAYAYLVDGARLTDKEDSLHLTDQDLCALYESTCKVTGDKIGYIELDTSLLPLYYGDSSTMSTVGYLGGYTVSSTGGVNGYYTVYSYTGYNYAVYQDPMYKTFAYQGLIGITPTQAGSGSSIALLSSLSLSDGTLKATPGSGLNGFAIDYWHVMYNPDSNATGSSSGWVDMDAYEAIAKQKTDGGLINYLASTVVYKYVGMSSVHTGTVQTDDGKALEGVTVNVYSVDSDGTRTLYSQCVTDSKGYYSVGVPTSGKIAITFSTSATSVRQDGNVFATYYAVADVPTVVQVAKTAVSGFLANSDGKAISYTGILELKAVTASGESDTAIRCNITDGTFTTEKIAPGTYNYSIYAINSERGATIATGSIVIADGSSEGVILKVSAYSLTVTVTDQTTGLAIHGLKVAYVDTSTGKVVATATTDEDGKAVAYLLAGTYSAYVVDDDYVSVSTTTTTISSSTATMSLTAYTGTSMTVSGVPSGTAVSIVSQAFTTVTTTGTVMIPKSLGIDATYFAYALVGDKLYAGSGNSSGITLAEQSGYTEIKVTVNNSDNKAVSGVTVSADSEKWFVSGVTDKDGKVTLAVPKDSGTYTVYTASGTTCAISTSVSSTDGSDLTMKLVDGVSINLTMYFYTGMASGSSKVVPFIDDFMAVLTFNSQNVTLYHLMTDSSGAVKLTIPKSSDAKITYTVSVVNNDTVYIGSHDSKTGVDSAVTRELSSSGTFYIQRTEPSSSSTSYGTSYMKKVDAPELNSGLLPPTTYTGQLINYNSSSTTYIVDEGVIKKLDNDTLTVVSEIEMGQYTFKTGTWSSDWKTFTAGLDKNGWYYNAYVYLYYGAKTFEWQDDKLPFQAYVVNTKVSTGDTITIYSYDDDARYETVTSNEKYYCETGHVFRFTATDKDSKVSIQNTTADTENTLDFTSKVAEVTVKGSIDAPNASGKLIITNTTTGVKFIADVSSGAYSIKLPVGETYEFSVLADGVTYDDKTDTYTYALDPVQRTVPADAKDDITFNVGVTTSSIAADSNDYVKVSITSASVKADGTASVTADITYIGTEYDKVTYLIKGSDGLILDKIQSYVFEKNVTYTITVHGYVPTSYGACSTKVALSITTSDGTSVASVPLPDNAFETSTGGKVTVTLAGGTVEKTKIVDSYNGYSYRYAFNVKNENSYAVNVTLNGTLTLGVTGWTVFVADSNGNEVYTAPHAITVGGKTNTTLYLVVFTDSAVSYDNVPPLTYEVSAKNLDGDDVSITSASATGSVSKKTIEVDQTSTSVTNADNSANQISLAFYILVVIAVLLLLVFIWAASKRGVFSRK